VLDRVSKAAYVQLTKVSYLRLYVPNETAIGPCDQHNPCRDLHSATHALCRTPT